MHYWVDQYLNGQPTLYAIFEDKDELREGMNDLVQQAGRLLDVPLDDYEYGMSNGVVVRNKKWGNEIHFQVSRAYTEEELVAAGLLGGEELDEAVWGGMFSWDDREKITLP